MCENFLKIKIYAKIDYAIIPLLSSHYNHFMALVWYSLYIN